MLRQFVWLRYSEHTVSPDTVNDTVDRRRLTLIHFADRAGRVVTRHIIPKVATLRPQSEAVLSAAIIVRLP